MKTKTRHFLLHWAVAVCVLTMCGCTPQPPRQSSDLLRDIYADCFSIGAAVMPYSLEKYENILPHFNSVTAENSMKWRVTEPNEGEYDYTDGDAIIEWAREHDTAVRGHCLLWYKSLPAWVSERATDKQTALELIDTRVRETVAHFGSSVYAWDVVNEALCNSVSDEQLRSGDIYRTNVSGSGLVDWYALCGVDFIKQAFMSAAAARDEAGLDFDLYYNDYSLNNPNKREACVRLVKMLQDANIPIDGVGMQAHYRLYDYLQDPQRFIAEFENSVKAFTSLGVDVQITELDICVYHYSDDLQKFDRLPYDVEAQQAQMYADLFAVCRKYSVPQSGRGAVTNVTTWGVADANTAQNTSRHKEYPLIFSTESTPKLAYYSITDF